MTGLRAVRLDQAALDDMAATLSAAELPIADLNEDGCVFFRFDDGDGSIGFGGLEGDGPDRLLRSVVVAPDRHRAGLGCAIINALECEARALGVERLHLLTTTAAAFFRQVGYDDADRGSAPSTVAGSREFTALCPASAAYFTKAL